MKRLFKTAAIIGMLMIVSSSIAQAETKSMPSCTVDLLCSADTAQLSYNYVGKYLIQDQSIVEDKDGQLVQYTIIGTYEINGQNVIAYLVAYGENREIILCTDPFRAPYPSSLLLFKAETGKLPTIWFMSDGELIHIYDFSCRSEKIKVREQVFQVNDRFTLIDTNTEIIDIDNIYDIMQFFR